MALVALAPSSSHGRGGSTGRPAANRGQAGGPHLPGRAAPLAATAAATAVDLDRIDREQRRTALQLWRFRTARVRTVRGRSRPRRRRRDPLVRGTGEAVAHDLAQAAVSRPAARDPALGTGRARRPPRGPRAAWRSR